MRNSTYKCKTCGAESKVTHHKKNVYCSIACTTEAKLLLSVQRLKEGKLTERVTMRKALARINGYKCTECGISEYNGKPIVLQVDHIDGNAGNHRMENLRLICPNCHSQTNTFSGANKGNGRAARGLPLR